LKPDTAPASPLADTPLPPAPLADAHPDDVLEIVGAREHNLKNIDVRLPRERLVVITGVSGSGKSSLAFDTLYAEGQRRYLETFSGYVRQFIGGIERPDVDKVSGLSPVIAIDQKTTSKNPRSTVGTITEVYDFLRLLYARTGEAYSYLTGRRMEKLSDDEIIQRIVQQYEGKSVSLLAPVIKGRKGHYREELEKIQKWGFARARIDGVVVELAPKMSLDRYKTHDIEMVIDKLTVDDKSMARLTQSVQTALKYGKDSMLLLDTATQLTQWYCRNLMDPESGLSYDEPAPNSFSFNSPYGACPQCQGLGRVMSLNEGAIVPDPAKTLARGALAPLETHTQGDKLTSELKSACRAHKIATNVAYGELSDTERNLLLEGDAPAEILSNSPDIKANSLLDYGFFIGLRHYLLRRYNHGSETERLWAEQYLNEDLCPTCNGGRLKRESLSFYIDGKNIHDVASLSLADLAQWADDVEARLTPRQQAIAQEILKEIRKRVGFLLEVGLSYLTLDRAAMTLSGGEAQRIRLATQIGSQLVGVLYILDEPSIGLHQRDNARLIRSLKQLRDLGNSIIVVEHDKDMMLEADYILDIGPGAGVHGGRVVAAGTPQQFTHQPGMTAEYLTGRRQIAIPTQRRPRGERALTVRGATGHNLRDVTVNFPLGNLICVTGVSGSGKSSLVNGTLYPVLHKHSYGFSKTTLPHQAVEGLQMIDKVIEIDQKPIGRTPRSNPATYTSVFTFIRELFAGLPEAQIRGYAPGRFSFNVKGGRCETCGGAGVQVIEMNFLPDVHVECPDCRGRRYNRETLEVRYKGKSIADVLNMTVDKALEFFEPVPRIRHKIQALQDVGLGYITLGQAATTISGGEAQRLKIATELSKRDTGRTFYILDEPTTGLHFQDIQHLLDVLQRLVDKGNTVLVIEHNLDVVKVADWVIDMGPEGGTGGGQVLVEGTPEDVARCPHSHTGRFLAKELGL